MIFPLLGPPRLPARTYHRRRLQEVSEVVWAGGISRAWRVSPCRLGMGVKTWALGALAFLIGNGQD
jgi:hypothetical protein